MQPLPQYEEDGSEQISFQNIWRNIDPQEVTGVDCFQPFANINNGMNRFVMDITGVDFTKMFSALMNGSQLTYPQEWMQIVVNFLKMVHCPIDFEEECQTYPPYTPIIQYQPMNPFRDPAEIPDGYLIPPIVLVTEDNIDEYPQNEIGDVTVPFGAITFDANWFEDIAGQLPTITIKVTGEGVVNIQFLNQAQGGLVVVTVDNPPNLVDIIAGIVTGAENIIDVNQDLVSLPPETAVEHIFPVQVTGAGNHTIYAVFLPILDDSLIPLRFGGGFRSIELCDFGEMPDMGITDIRYDFTGGQGMIQAQILGEWVDKINLYNAVDDAVNPVIFTNFFNNGTDQIILQQETTGGGGFQDVAEIDLSHLDNAAAAAAAQATANNAEALASAAQDTADGAVAVNTAQDDRLDTIEADIVTINSQIDALDARIDALENVSMWVEEWDFEVSDFGISPTNATYSGGTGFSHTQGTGDVVLQSINPGANANQIDTIEVGYLFSSGETGAPTNVSEQRLNSVSPYANIDFTGSGNTGVGFIRVPNNPSSNNELQIQDFGNFTVKYIRFYGRGENPF